MELVAGGLAIVKMSGLALVLLRPLTLIAAALVSVDMLAALFMLHLENGYLVSSGGVELVLAMALIAASMALQGPRRLSLERQLLYRELVQAVPQGRSARCVP